MAQSCLMISRFEKNLVGQYKNDLIKAKSVIKNFDGQNVFTSDKVTIPHRSDFFADKFGIGFLYFPDIQSARRFIASDKVIRQQDWLNNVDILVVPCCIPPPAGPGVLSIREIRTSEGMRGNMNVPTDLDFIQSKGGVIISDVDTPEKARGIWNPRNFSVVIWPNKAAVDAYLSAEETVAYTDSLSDVAQVNFVIFEV